MRLDETIRRRRRRACSRLHQRQWTIRSSGCDLSVTPPGVSIRFPDHVDDHRYMHTVRFFTSLFPSFEKLLSRLKSLVSNCKVGDWV
jgi:hypothetical protein